MNESDGSAINACEHNAKTLIVAAAASDGSGVASDQHFSHSAQEDDKEAVAAPFAD